MYLYLQYNEKTFHIKASCYLNRQANPNMKRSKKQCYIIQNFNFLKNICEILLDIA